MVQGRCTNWYVRWWLTTRGGGRLHGACRGRGEATPQGDDLVGRLRRRTGEPGVPDRCAGRLDRCARNHGRVRPVDDLGPARSAAEQRLCRDGDDVPAEGRRHLAVRARGVAEVPLLHRPDRDVRLLVRVVERAGDQRLRDRDARAGRVVREHDVHPGRRQLPVEPAGLDRHRLHHRRLALQHLRRTAGGVAQLRDRRPADPPRRRPDVPPVHHRRLVERQHDLGDRQRRRPRAGAHLALLHGVVGVRLRDGGGVRAGIPQPRVGYARGRCAPRRPSRWSCTRCCRSASAERSAPRPSPATRRRSPSTRRPSTCSSAMRSRTCSSCA